MSFIGSVYSVKVFSENPVGDKEIEQILACGIKAPSARNGQPWHFTVVRSLDKMRKLLPDAKPGNALIVVSGVEKKTPGISVDLDCALATENMYLAAQAMGLGSHMYTGPINNINSNFKDLIKIPNGYSAVAMLKIGNVEKPLDAVSAASARKPFSELVNFE